jgi:hypothetical protein
MPVRERETAGNHRHFRVDVSKGWSRVKPCTHTRRNPEAARGTVIDATATDPKRFRTPELLVSILLNKTDGSPWTDDHIQPIESKPL